MDDAHHRGEASSGTEKVTRQAWTITEAVERTGASRSTLRRYREGGRFPNAYKDSGGVWRFPLEDLLASGLHLIDPAHAEQVNEVSDHGQFEPERVRGDLLSRVTELEQALAVEQAKNEGLERLAHAAQENAADLRRALRMLEVSTPDHVKDEHVNTVTEHGVSTPPEQVNTSHEQGGHPRWSRFSRWFGRG